MDLKKCENNHYYDGDKYTVCPHCELSEVSVERENLTRSITTIEKNKSDENKNSVRLRHRWFEKKQGSSTDVLQQDDIFDKNKAIDMDKEYAKENNNEEKKDDNESLDEVVSISKALNSVKESVRTSAVSEDSNKTVSIFSNSKGIEPPVGWLVCVEGENEGVSYEIHAGKNHIGRSSVMDIVIIGDNKISREKQCVVMYEPVEKLFYILGSESGGMNYLNNKIILEPYVELKAYDRIKMGDTELLFIPLCGENFSWEKEK